MPLDRSKERQLIIECQEARQKSDATAFEVPFTALFDGHYAAVLTISRRITRSREDAEEVANDAFADLDRKILIVEPEKGCLGLLRQFSIRRAAEKYSRMNARLRAKFEVDVDPDNGVEAVSAVPSPEDGLLEKEAARIRLSNAECMARMLCGRESGAPHERIVYLLHRKLEYKPARLVEENFSSRKLGENCESGGIQLLAIEHELEREWARRSQLRPDRVAQIFAPLREDLKLLLGCYPLHGSTRKIYRSSQIWDLPISQGRLREYFHSSPPTEDIRMWWVNVEKRVVKLARKSGIGETPLAKRQTQ